MRKPYAAAAGTESGHLTESGEARMVAETVLDDAVEALVNGVRGYQSVAERAEDAAVRDTFSQLGQARKQALDEVVKAAAGARVEVDVNGTAPGALHRAWIAVEGAVAGDQALIESAQTGESHAASELDRVLAEALPEEVAEALRQALADVESARNTLEKLEI